MLNIRERASVPASWASAGIVDARAFYIGDSKTIHALTHASPNRVRAACGITAPVVETDRPRASWSAFLPTCPTCKRNTGR